MPLTRIDPPATLPVSLEEMKSHSHIDGALEDARISDFLRTATARLDGRDGLLGRCLITQSWRLTLDGFPPEIALPLPPCQSVIEIRYVDAAGALRTLAPVAYQVFGFGDADPAWIRPAFGGAFPASRRSPESVIVEFRAGYGDAAADVPEPLRTAIKMHAGHLHEHRESVAAGTFAEVPQGYHDLVGDYRIWSF
jgi:uncharacterized phiE125 gp8 family phage protein